MTLKKEKDHFELNFQGQEVGFQFEEGYYKKTIDKDYLVVGFDDETMVSKTLNFTIKSTFQIGNFEPRNDMRI